MSRDDNHYSGQYFDGERFRDGEITIRNGIIQSIRPISHTINGKQLLIPGITDHHIHFKGYIEGRVPPKIAVPQQFIDQKVKKLYQYGITEIHDMGYDLPGYHFCSRIDQKNTPLTVKRYLPASQIDQLRRNTGLKLYLDGEMGDQTAAIDGSGTLFYTNQQLKEIFLTVFKQNGHVACHTIGNDAINQVLNILDQLQIPLRIRLEHAQVINKSDLKRIKQHNITLSMQSLHYFYDQNLYQQRTETLFYPFRSILNHKIPLVFGSDSPIVSINPFEGVYQAVYGRKWGENITLEDALACYCSGKKIKEGMIADYAIIDHFLTKKPEKWSEIRSHYTVINGVVVYRT